MHEFELHEFFHSQKNVHLKALLYISCYITVWMTRRTRLYTMVFCECWNLLLRNKVCKVCKAIWALPFTIKPLLQTASLQLLLAARLDSPRFLKFFGEKIPSLCNIKINLNTKFLCFCLFCFLFWWFKVWTKKWYLFFSHWLTQRKKHKRRF